MAKRNPSRANLMEIVSFIVKIANVNKTKIIKMYINAIILILLHTLSVQRLSYYYALGIHTHGRHIP